MFLKITVLHKKILPKFKTFSLLSLHYGDPRQPCLKTATFLSNNLWFWYYSIIIVRIYYSYLKSYLFFFIIEQFFWGSILQNSCSYQILEFLVYYNMLNTEIFYIPVYLLTIQIGGSFISIWIFSRIDNQNLKGQVLFFKVLRCRT